MWVQRIAHLHWLRDGPDGQIMDYKSPTVIPLAQPKREWVFPPIDKRTHVVLPQEDASPHVPATTDTPPTPPA